MCLWEGGRPCERVDCSNSPLCGGGAGGSGGRAHRQAQRHHFPALCQDVYKRQSELFSCKDSDLRISCANGNSVIFKGLDDTEKLKSITFPKGELTDIWIEEASEILEEDFNQLDVRLRGKGAHKQMVLTFNPVSVLHWLKLRFFDRKDPRALVLKSTYKDNQFLDEDYKRTLEGYKDTDPYYYSVYCLGEWGVLGQTIFDAQKVSERLSQLAGPVRRGEFTFATWYSPEANEVLIDDSTIRWVEMDLSLIHI